MQITFGALNLTPTPKEEASVFNQEAQRQVDLSLPIRATTAVQYDRQNRLYTVRPGTVVREFDTYAEAHTFACNHPDEIFDAGKASVTFTKGGQAETLTNALGTARIVKTAGVAVWVEYEFRGGPWS